MAGREEFLDLAVFRDFLDLAVFWNCFDLGVFESSRQGERVKKTEKESELGGKKAMAERERRVIGRVKKR